MRNIKNMLANTLNSEKHTRALNVSDFSCLLYTDVAIDVITTAASQNTSTVRRSGRLNVPDGNTLPRKSICFNSVPRLNTLPNVVL